MSAISWHHELRDGVGRRALLEPHGEITSVQRVPTVLDAPSFRVPSAV